MDNKLSKKILFGVLILIWIVAGFQLYSKFFKSTPAIESSHFQVTAPNDTIRRLASQFQLPEDLKDPFGVITSAPKKTKIKKPVKSKSSVIKKVVPKKIIAPKRMTPFPKIQYNGYILKKNTISPAAVITYKGTTKPYKAFNKIDSNLLVLRIYEDSIVVRRDSVTRTFPLQTK